MLTLACTTRDHQMPFSRKFFEFIHMPINCIFDVENVKSRNVEKL